MKLGVVHIEAVHHVLAVAHFFDLLVVVLVVVDTLGERFDTVLVSGCLIEAYLLLDNITFERLLMEGSIPFYVTLRQREVSNRFHQKRP